MILLSYHLPLEGHGLVVETHYGRIRITDTEIHHNMGNGIKAKFLDGKWPFYEGETFCEESDQLANTYPYVVSAIPTIKSTSHCKRVSAFFFQKEIDLLFVRFKFTKKLAASSSWRTLLET